MGFIVTPYEKRTIKPESVIYDTLCNEYSDKFIKNVDKIVRYIQMWRIEKSSEMSSRNLGKRIIMTDNIISGLFDVAEVSEKFIIDTIKKSKFIKPSWEISGKPFNQLLAVLIFFYYNHTPDKLRPDYKDYNKLNGNLINTSYDWVNLFLAYKYFTSLQYKYFKHNVDESVMEYTINNMCKKFDIVKAESIMQIIDDKAFTNILYYEGFKRFKKPNTENDYEIKKSDKGDRFKFNIFTDENIADYINYLNNRLSDFMKNIAQQYYKNHASGKSSIMEAREIENEEGKKSLVIQTNISNDIVIMTRKLLLNMQKDTNIDVELLRKACKNTGTNYKSMSELIDNLRMSEKDLIPNANKTKKQTVEEEFELIESTSLSGGLILNCIAMYIVSLGQPLRNVHSSNFILECIRAYSISHSNDKYVLKTKEILDEIIEKYKAYYLRVGSTSVKNATRRCIFIYFVLYIAKYADI